VKRWEGVANFFGDFPEAPRILLLKLDHIGDFVTALEAMTKIRAAWPKASLTLLCGSWNTDFAEATGLFDRVVVFDFYPASHEVGKVKNPSFDQSVSRFTALGLGHFDLAVDLRHDPDTRVLLRRVQATYKAGFATGPGGEGLDLIVPEIENSARSSKSFVPFQAATRLTLLADAVIATFKGPDNTLPVNTLRASSAYVAFPPGERYVVLSSASGSALRRWPVERWGQLARCLIGEGYKIVFVGGENERAELDRLLRELPPDAAVNLAGRLPFKSLTPVLADAALFAGNDTGVTHLAAYLGVPTLAVYSGVNEPNVWMPRGRRVFMLRASAPCSPCNRRDLDECERSVPCIAEITVDKVFCSAQELLARVAHA
jgi:ADP-heptose:LPS heptosyltransferase